MAEWEKGVRPIFHKADCARIPTEALIRRFRRFSYPKSSPSTHYRFPPKVYPPVVWWAIFGNLFIFYTDDTDFTVVMFAKEHVNGISTAIYHRGLGFKFL